MLAFVVIPLIYWIPHSIGVAITDPNRRKAQIIRVLIWVAAVLMVATVHYVRHVRTRQHADEIVRLINEFSVQHQRCPAKLDE